MAFSIRFTEGVHPGKKLQMLKRSAEEIYDASAAVLTNREVYNIKLYNYYSFKKCNALYVYFIYSFHVSFKAI
jgi:hypothetical protein